uniref:BMERB domain-containing protein n=1 Tax=Globodera pallida TaxID=36090 RepID=A0A183CR94_GLOPA
MLRRREDEGTLKRELTDRQSGLDELFDVVEKQKEVIAKQDRDQLEHEQTKAELKVIHHMKRLSIGNNPSGY